MWPPTTAPAHRGGLEPHAHKVHGAARCTGGVCSELASSSSLQPLAPCLAKTVGLASPLTAVCALKAGRHLTVVIVSSTMLPCTSLLVKLVHCTGCGVSILMYDVQKSVRVVHSHLAQPPASGMDPRPVAPVDNSWSTATVKAWTRSWQTSVAWNHSPVLVFTRLSSSHRAFCAF